MPAYFRSLHPTKSNAKHYLLNFALENSNEHSIHQTWWYVAYSAQCVFFFNFLLHAMHRRYGPIFAQVFLFCFFFYFCLLHNINLTLFLCTVCFLWLNWIVTRFFIFLGLLIECPKKLVFLSLPHRSAHDLLSTLFMSPCSIRHLAVLLHAFTCTPCCWIIENYACTVHNNCYNSGNGKTMKIACRIERLAKRNLKKLPHLYYVHTF